MFVNYFGGKIEYFREGGPENRPFVRITSSDGEARLQQNNLYLVQGEKYRLGAWIRCSGITGKNSGIQVGPGSFAKPGANALIGLPENSAGWKYYEREITMVDEVKPYYPYYTVDLVLDSRDGVLDVAAVSLLPLTEKARRGSLSQMAAMTPGLVPASKLWYIAQNNAKLDFFWVGTFPGDPEDEECEFIFRRDGAAATVPFAFPVSPSISPIF